MIYLEDLKRGLNFKIKQEEEKNNYSVKRLREISAHINFLGLKPSLIEMELVVNGQNILEENIEVFIGKDPYEITLRDKDYLELELNSREHLVNVTLINETYDIDGVDYTTLTMNLGQYTEEEEPNNYPVIYVTYHLDMADKSEIIVNVETLNSELTEQNIKNIDRTLSSFFSNKVRLSDKLVAIVSDIKENQIYDSILNTLKGVQDNKLFEPLINGSYLEYNQVHLSYIKDKDFRLHYEFVGRDFNWNFVQPSELSRSMLFPFTYSMNDLSWKSSSQFFDGFKQYEMKEMEENGPLIKFSSIVEEYFGFNPIEKIKIFIAEKDSKVDLVVKSRSNNLFFKNKEGKLLAWVDLYYPTKDNEELEGKLVKFIEHIFTGLERSEEAWKNNI